MIDLFAAVVAIPGVGPFIPYVTAAVTVCAVVSAALPPPKDDSSPVYVGVYKFINTVGANVGHAANNKPTN